MDHCLYFSTLREYDSYISQLRALGSYTQFWYFVIRAWVIMIWRRRLLSGIDVGVCIL